MLSLIERHRIATGADKQDPAAPHQAAPAPMDIRQLAAIPRG